MWAISQQVSRSPTQRSIENRSTANPNLRLWSQSHSSRVITITLIPAHSSYCFSCLWVL